MNKFVNNAEETMEEKSIRLKELQQLRNPFEYLHIADNTFLNDIDGRHSCKKCHRSRKLFCYTCLLPSADIADLLPVVKLPIKIDIIKHKKETDGKSTAVHAAILASDDVSIYTYPDIPDYENEHDTTVLIFPSPTCTNVHGIFDRHVRLKRAEPLPCQSGYNASTLLKHRLCEIEEDLDQIELISIANETVHQHYTLDNFPIKRAVFIDSTWNQCRGIYKDSRLNRLQTVVIQHRLSQFWRHQKNSPRWYLATIEAIHQFLIEIHVNAWGLDTSYRGLDGLEVDLEFAKDHLVEQKSNAKRDNDLNLNQLTVPYNGQYDNLLFFFTHMYKLIHTYYDHNKLKSYRRPIR